ncbi:MAG: hypothetical protein WA019_01805, partial [Candidatus Moraniibacteriota bacterium]
TIGLEIEDVGKIETDLEIGGKFSKIREKARKLLEKAKMAIAEAMKLEENDNGGKNEIDEKQNETIYEKYEPVMKLLAEAVYRCKDGEFDFFGGQMNSEYNKDIKLKEYLEREANRKEDFENRMIPGLALYKKYKKEKSRENSEGRGFLPYGEADNFLTYLGNYIADDMRMYLVVNKEKIEIDEEKSKQQLQQEIFDRVMQDAVNRFDGHFPEKKVFEGVIEEMFLRDIFLLAEKLSFSPKNEEIIKNLTSAVVTIVNNSSQKKSLVDHISAPLEAIKNSKLREKFGKKSLLEDTYKKEERIIKLKQFIFSTNVLGGLQDKNPFLTESLVTDDFLEYVEKNTDILTNSSYQFQKKEYLEKIRKDWQKKLLEALPFDDKEEMELLKIKTSQKNDKSEKGVTLRKILDAMLNADDPKEVGFEYYLSCCSIDDSIKFKQSLSLSEQAVQRVVKNFFIDDILEDRADHAKEIKEKFSMPEGIFEEAAPDFPDGATIKDIIKIKEIPNIGKYIALSLRNLKNFSFSRDIEPIMNAQGGAAHLYFDSIKKIPDYKNLTSEDVKCITLIGKKYGTQARNILDNVLSKVGVGNIGREKEIIEEYLSEINIAHFDIYSQYKKNKTENNLEGMKELKDMISKTQDKIYKGKIKKSDFKNSLYSAISYYTFPPASGLTADQYDQLNKNRPDRRNDVPKSLEELQYQKIEVSTGKYNLGEGEELDLKEWVALGEAIKKVNAEFEKEDKVKLNEVEIAERLIEIYKNKSSEKDEDKEYLFESMYRYHLARGGGKLESGFEISIEGLMKYKEFIGERIKNDLIKDCFKKWRETHEKEFEELKNDALNRLRSSQSQNFAKVNNMLNAIKKQDDPVKKEKVIGNLDEFLKDFGMSYGIIKDMDVDKIKNEVGATIVEYEGSLTEEDYRSEEYYNSKAFLKAFDEFSAKHDSDQLVYQKISSDLISDINKKMRKEVDKFKFEEQSGQAEKRELEFVISKKKEHGVAGHNMGVCVASDEKLWNDPQFMNCIIFDSKTKKAMGGMHFFIRENNLCLPGINPSLDILGQVKNEELFDRMIEYAREVKEKMGLEKILIPRRPNNDDLDRFNPVIASNRFQIQEIIQKKSYGKYSLKKEVRFSYSPYEYSFQQCFEV